MIALSWALACTCRPELPPPDAVDWEAVAATGQASLLRADLVRASALVEPGMPFAEVSATLREALGEPATRDGPWVWYALGDGVDCHRLWVMPDDGRLDAIEVQPWRCPSPVM